MMLIDFFNWTAEQFTQLVNQGKTYVFLLPIYTGMLLTERIAYELTTRRKWNDSDGAANLFITVVQLGKDLFLGKLLPLGLVILLYENCRLFTLSHTWAGWLVAFLLYDLAWYWDHRIAHRTGLFWAFHHVHHSSQEYNFTVASRGFWLDNMVTRPLFYLLPILGISPFQYISIQILTSIFGIFQHTRLIHKMPVFDWFLATPSNHRVHHGADLKYLDKNYGEVLIIWDKLFGTYQKEEEEPHYGLVKNIETNNPLAIEVAGIRWLWKQMQSATRWQDKLRYLYMPPGWRHDGSGETTEDLLAQQKLVNTYESASV